MQRGCGGSQNQTNTRITTLPKTKKNQGIEGK